MSEGWDPREYGDDIRAEIPLYDELQERAVAATAGMRVRRMLELGVGTGETARLLLALHSDATLVGVDGNEAMLDAARAALPEGRVDLRLGRLEEPLPDGPFDLVVSVLAVHHLDAKAKAALFRRVAEALAPGGRSVFGDVVVPERPEEAVIPLEAGFDLPDSVEDQLGWLTVAGLRASVSWSAGDLAVLVAYR